MDSGRQVLDKKSQFKKLVTADGLSVRERRVRQYIGELERRKNIKQ